MNMSNEKTKLVVSGDIGDYVTTQLYRDYFISNHYKVV